MIEYLASVCEALDLIPITKKMCVVGKQANKPKNSIYILSYTQTEPQLAISPNFVQDTGN